MSGDLGRDAEAAARRQLTRLIDAIAVDDAVSGPSDVVGEGTDTKRPRWLVVAAAAVLVVGLASGVPLLVADDPTAVSIDEERCRPTDLPVSESDEYDIAQGQLPDGRSWSFRVSGRVPDIRQEVRVEGQPPTATEFDGLSWDSAVRDGLLSWSADWYSPRPDGGFVAYGGLPIEAASLDVGLPDGEHMEFCPVSVPGISAYRFVAGALPPYTGEVTLTARDGAGRIVAKGTITEETFAVESIPPSDGMPATEGLAATALNARMEIEPSNVMVPLGGPAEIATGQLPDGRSWAVVASLARTGSVSYSLNIVSSTETNTSSITIDPSETEPVARVVKPVWRVELVDGSYVIWGLLPDSTERVIVSQDDDNQQEALASDSRFPGLGPRLFVAALPSSAAFSDVASLDAAGHIEHYAVNVDEVLERLLEEDGSALLEVVAHEQGPMETPPYERVED